MKKPKQKHLPLKTVPAAKLASKVWTPPVELPEGKLISKREMLDLVPLSYPTVWKLMQEGTFPRAIAIGAQNFWRDSEVREWINSQPLRQFKNDKVRA